MPPLPLIREANGDWSQRLFAHSSCFEWLAVWGHNRRVNLNLCMPDGVSANKALAGRCLISRRVFIKGRWFIYFLFWKHLIKNVTFQNRTVEYLTGRPKSWTLSSHRSPLYPNSSLGCKTIKKFWRINFCMANAVLNENFSFGLFIQRPSCDHGASTMPWTLLSNSWRSLRLGVWIKFVKQHGIHQRLPGKQLLHNRPLITNNKILILYKLDLKYGGNLIQKDS